MLHQRNMKEVIGWLFLFHENKVYMADPLGFPIQNYQILYSRLIQFSNEVTQVFKLKPVQNQNSKLCRLFCIYIAHVMFGYEYPLLLNMNDSDLIRFANHML